MVSSRHYRPRNSFGIDQGRVPPGLAPFETWDGNAGTISMTFNLVFNGTTVSQTDNATVECPK